MRDLALVDVGNTETRFGLARGGELVGTRMLTTPARLTADEAEMRLCGVLASLGARGDRGVRDGDAVGGAMLSCVVPSLTRPWRDALARVSATRPLVVGPGLRTGVRMRYNDPSEVGPDRVADVVAASAAYGAPLVVVDLGTTTNFEVIDRDGTFVGGIIAPGLRLGSQALSRAGARLPAIELRAPGSVIGRSTQTAMQAGVILGEAARIDGLVDAIAGELGYEARVVLSGEDAPAMAALLQHEATVDEDLTLRGLALLWQRNQR